MTLLKKIAATDYSLGRGILAAIRRMKDKWTSAKAFAKENDSTAFAEYRKMTRIERLLMQELGNKRQANLKVLQEAIKRARTAEPYVEPVFKKPQTDESKHPKIEIRKQYSWYTVYLNNTMILSHQSQEDVDEIIAVLKSEGAPFIYRETEESRWADEQRQKEQTQTGGVSYSPASANADYKKPITAEDVKTLRSIERKSINKFSSDDLKKTEKWAYKFQKELGTKSPFFRAWFGDWRVKDHTPYSSVIASKENGTLSSGKTVNADTKKAISWGNTLKGETITHAAREKASIEALKDIKTIVENAVLLDTVISTPDSKSKMPNTAFMHSFYALYKSDKGVELLKLFVEEALSNDKETVFSRAYELKDIQKIADAPNGVLANDGGLTDDASAVNSISDLFELVKTYDKSFQPKVVNPLLLNEDGTPRVVYHGTPNKGFTIFKLSEDGALGKGIYFSESLGYAKGLSFGQEPYQVYLNIQNPYVVNYPGNYDMQKLIAQGYDGIYHKGNGFWVAFYPEQIKSATDNIGTYDKANPDIRYSPVSPSTDSRYLELARDPQKNESELRRLVKEAAEKAGFNSPLLYHGTDYYGKITVFRKGKTGYLGGGIYFTDSETNAKRYTCNKPKTTAGKPPRSFYRCVIIQ